MHQPNNHLLANSLVSVHCWPRAPWPFTEISDQFDWLIATQDFVELLKHCSVKTTFIQPRKAGKGPKFSRKIWAPCTTTTGLPPARLPQQERNKKTQSKSKLNSHGPFLRASRPPGRACCGLGPLPSHARWQSVAPLGRKMHGQMKLKTTKKMHVLKHGTDLGFPFRMELIFVFVFLSFGCTGYIGLWCVISAFKGCV